MNNISVYFVDHRAGEHEDGFEGDYGVIYGSEIHDAKQMALMARIQRFSGKEFDTTYLKDAGVKSHQEMEMKRKSPSCLLKTTRKFVNASTIAEYLKMTRTIDQDRDETGN